MVARGVYFAITQDELAKLSAAQGDDAALMGLVEQLEQAWDGDWLTETDKAWDAIHRCLTDGRLEFGDTTAHKCVLGAESLYQADDYIICPLTPADVSAVAALLQTIDQAELRKRYFGLDAEDYGMVLAEDDFQYTWAYLEDITGLFAKAAGAGRAMVFTVSQ